MEISSRNVFFNDCFGKVNHRKKISKQSNHQNEWTCKARFFDFVMQYFVMLIFPLQGQYGPNLV